MRMVADTVHQTRFDLRIQHRRAINLLIVLKRLSSMRCLLEEHRFLSLAYGINTAVAICRIRSLIHLLAWKLHNNRLILPESLDTPTLSRLHALLHCFLNTLHETLPVSAATSHSCNVTSANESSNTLNSTVRAVQPGLYTTCPDHLIHTQTAEMTMSQGYYNQGHCSQEKEDRTNNTISRLRKVVGIRRVWRLALRRGLGRRLLVMWKGFLQRIFMRRVWSLLGSMRCRSSRRYCVRLSSFAARQELLLFITAVVVPQALAMVHLHALDHVPFEFVPSLQLSFSFLTSPHARQASITATSVARSWMKGTSVSRRTIKNAVVSKDNTEELRREKMPGGSGGQSGCVAVVDKIKSGILCCSVSIFGSCGVRVLVLVLVLIFDFAFGLVLLRLWCIARCCQRVGTIHIVIYMSIDGSMLLLELGEQSQFLFFSMWHLNLSKYYAIGTLIVLSTRKSYSTPSEHPPSAPTWSNP
jgi:hypothetical protein